MTTKPKLLNKRTDKISKGSIYIGRPSKWGNPFPLKREEDRDKILKKYEDWIMKNKELLAQISELRGKDLVCWCAPKKCHGEILLKLANEEN